MDRYQEGFSLLELLIYMAIVSLLVVAAIPKFNQVMATANTAKIQMDLASLNTAIAMYEAQTGQAPKNLDTDLSEYLTDIGQVRPPKGECFLKTGEKIVLKDTVYQLNAEGLEALCEQHALHDFGRGEKES